MKKSIVKIGVLLQAATFLVVGCGKEAKIVEEGPTKAYRGAVAGGVSLNSTARITIQPGVSFGYLAGFNQEVLRFNVKLNERDVNSMQHSLVRTGSKQGKPVYVVKYNTMINGMTNPSFTYGIQVNPGQTFQFVMSKGNVSNLPSCSSPFLLFTARVTPARKASLDIQCMTNSPAGGGNGGGGNGGSSGGGNGGSTGGGNGGSTGGGNGGSAGGGNDGGTGGGSGDSGGTPGEGIIQCPANLNCNNASMGQSCKRPNGKRGVWEIAIQDISLEWRCVAQN